MNTRVDLLKKFVADQLSYGGALSWTTDDVMPKDGPVVSALTRNSRTVLVVEFVEGGRTVGFDLYTKISSASPRAEDVLQAAHEYLGGV